ncbi:MAG: hypothetical protein J6T10_07735 [Methanobrevibacter sp.]|nr:hypothetical protein [Methanobrevibacter sp.]
MSIKDNIKNELLERIVKRQNEIAEKHNQMLEVANKTSELLYEDGVISQIMEEYNFLYNLKRFVESL